MQHWFLRQARAPRLRTFRRFAGEELVLPTGPFAGRPFDETRLPWTRHWLDELDRGSWKRFVVEGPSQAGKSLMAFVLPVMYLLFELREPTVLVGVPTMEMAREKWEIDLEPAIRASRYAALLPRRGSGSRGGVAELMEMANGCHLRFMSGGGDDKVRAGITAKYLVATEANALDERSDASAEGTKIAQMRARLASFDEQAGEWLECTPTTDKALTARERESGSCGEIFHRCPHCRAFHQFGREQLVGWQDAESQDDARQRSAFYCPGCGEALSEEERREACLASVLVHKGQRIGSDGTVEGPLPKTTTCGFHWSAFDNLFRSAASLGVKEWEAGRAADPDAAEREASQFVWGQPVPEQIFDLTPLQPQQIITRGSGAPQGEVPAACDVFTLGIDVGDWRQHFVAAGFAEGATPHVVDYGTKEVYGPDDAKGSREDADFAILRSLRELRERIELGWISEQLGRRVPEWVFIDSRHRPEVVTAFCRESGPRYLPTIGWGATQKGPGYNRPRRLGNRIVHIGEGYDVRIDAARQTYVVHVNADHWKSFVHQRLHTPAGQTGGLVLFRGDRQRHAKFAKHLLAEKKRIEFVRGAGGGQVETWEALSTENHWLDALASACCAGHLGGARLLGEEQSAGEFEEYQADDGPDLRGPDGEPYFITDR